MEGLQGFQDLRGNSANGSVDATSANMDGNLGPALVITGSVLLALVVVTTALRLLVRARNCMLGCDDLTILLVAVLATARLGCQAAQVRHGDGRHAVMLDPEEYRAVNQLGWYALVLFFVAICLLKTSICLLLLRLKNERWLRWLIYGTMAGLVITNGGVVVILIAECRPLDAFWDGDMGRCWDPRVRVFGIYASIAYSILTDLLCSCLPLVVIWKVRIPLKSKLLVCGLMSLGLLATGCGIGRAVSLQLDNADYTWAFCVTEIWANFELFVGTIAANLAIARSIYLFFFEELGSSGASGAHPDGSGPQQGATVVGSTTGPHLHHRLSLYGYQAHGLSFLNGLHTPWSRGRRQSQRFNNSHHAFRRQSSYSPTTGRSISVDAHMDPAMDTTAESKPSKPSKLRSHFSGLSLPSWNGLHAWRGWARTSAASLTLPTVAMTEGTTVTRASREKGKIGSGIGVTVGITPVVATPESTFSSTFSSSGVAAIAPSSAVVIVGGRGRASTAGSVSGGSDIGSSTTIHGYRRTSRSRSNSRSSLLYHHHLHLSRHGSSSHPYGIDGTRSSSAATAVASDDSGLPAGSGVIRKRTEFWISEEELELDFEAPADDDHKPQDDRLTPEEERARSPALTASTAVEQGSAGDRSSSSTFGGAQSGGGGHNGDDCSGADVELGLHPPPRAHLP